MSIGKVIRYIRPGENNPRNSEGAFYTFPDGRIIFIYSRYKGTSHSDGATADLYMLESTDGGESFVDVGTVFTCEELGGSNIMSVSLLGMRDGQVGLFFIKKFADFEDTIMLSKSRDGRVWSTPERILFEEGFFVLNNDRAVRLRDGRIVLPYAYHHSQEVTLKEGRRHVFEPGLVYIYGSDDDENFYRMSYGYGINGTDAGCQEPLIIEHPDGRVECYIRTRIGAQYKMVAKDETLANWEGPARTDFISQEAPMSMKYIDENTLLAIWTTVRDNDNPEIFRQRYNAPSQGRCLFVYAISRDFGKTFTEPRVLEYDPTRGFCYCAIEPQKDSVLLAYCSGGGNDETCCLNRITIRKVKKSELV